GCGKNFPHTRTARALAERISQFRNKQTVNARVGCEFGMKSRYQLTALFDQHRVALIAGEHTRLGSYVPDNRSADKHGLQLARSSTLVEFGIRIQARDPAADLAPVTVALYAEVHQAQTLLGRM